MNKRLLVMRVCLVTLTGLLACSPAAAPTFAPQAPASSPTAVIAPAVPGVPAGSARAAWEEKWQETLAQAKKEGRLVAYITLGREQSQPITSVFEKNYGIRVESLSAAAAAVIPKIAAEQRAGIYAGDAWVSGSTTYTELGEAIESADTALILPELTEPELVKKTWYFGEIPWANKARTMLIGLMDPHTFMSANTDLVKAGEITAYRNLMDPKWKGKISLNDPRISGMGNMWFAVALDVGDVDVNFMRELVTKQEVFITRDWRLQVDWLARGKHAIAIAPSGPVVTTFIGLGAPINRFRIGTPSMSGGTSGIALLKRQPHPNAARLFINWLLSQEGQTLHSQVTGVQAQRLDASTAHLDPSKVVKPGLKFFKSDTEEFAAKRGSVYTPLAKEVFGP